MAQKKEAEKRLQKMTTEFVERITPMLFAPISMQQFVTAKDTQAKGPVLVSRTTLNKTGDEADLKRVVTQSLENLSSDKEKTWDVSIEDVDVQWISFNPSARDKEPEPSISEEEKYRNMMDITSETVILYAHGGFYYSGHPASVRLITLALARETGGRCVVPDYRLAPQNPFPAAIVDLLFTYLSLLYPSGSSMHDAIPAKKIVLAGDSSGGNLVLSLLALLQHFRDHHNGRVHFRGNLVDVPLPAGVATLSPHCDHTMSFESHARNKPYDIFVLDVLPHLQPSFPACDVWPTSPPREDIYCDGSTLLHPLVSVCIAPSWSAEGLPPMFIACGEEKLTDEAYYLAQRATKAGTTVHFSQYDALPHNFAAFFPRLPQSQHALMSCGSFCREAVQNSKGLKSTSTRYTVDDTDFKGIERDLHINIDMTERKQRMAEKVARRKPWAGPERLALL